MNEKGFAVTSLLYGAIALILIISIVVISVMTTTRSLNTDFVDIVEGELTLAIENYNKSIEPHVPELVGEMIPVIYSGGAWIKADITNYDDSWYDYEEQRWANVVTVSKDTRSTYISAEVGTTISLEHIDAMFVWIPRYSYTIKPNYGVSDYGGSSVTADTPGAINIKWVDNTITDTGSANYTGTTITNWYTPPGFCWGNSCDDPATRANAENRELNGIWVAKFETSTNDVTCNETATTANCSKILQPFIKPSVTSWRYADMSTGFNSIKNYMNGSNGTTYYGFTGSLYDSHYMKNTEWAVINYLSQSKYGKYGNESYLGANKEVAINNCNLYITGIGGDSVNASSSSSSCTKNTYDTTKGQAASTTGTVYGVYDMSGGAFEWVMANMKSTAGSFNPASSGFTSLELKYYNSYDRASSASDYSTFILGDSTKETALFYKDRGFMMHNGYESPWMIRGGLHSLENESGIFQFYFAQAGGASAPAGGNYANVGFRITVVPN